jgi:uncharacterized protein DUF6249
MDAPVAIIGVMIPMVAIVMGVGIGMLSLFLDYRKKREMFAMHHKERLAAIDKGMEVPPLPPEFFQDPRRRARLPGDYLRRGLILLLLGIAITIALYDTVRHEYLWGLVPVAIGIANLLYYWIESRRPSQGEPRQIERS